MKNKIFIISATALLSLTMLPMQAAASTLIEVGSTGQDVSTLQNNLDKVENAQLKADGLFGSLTKQAVVNFQLANNLTADGIFGPKTEASLTRQLKTVGIVTTANSFIGVPYLWGGTTLAGFDCSGLVQYVFAKKGISLPRVSKDQATVGTTVAFDNLQPGDLVFFSFLSDGEVSHVGIYLGNNEFISAQNSGVKIAQLGPYWKSHYVTAKRVY